MEKQQEIVLIAGGTGFIGKALVERLRKTHEVRILTRKTEHLNNDEFHWNPEKQELDEKALENVSILINLCGLGIADKRWTAQRKQELEDSRVIPAQFLYSKIGLLPKLKQYIAASGVNCYDYNNTEKIYTENDPMAGDYVSQLVVKWEQAAAIFEGACKVVKLRIGFVLADQGGAREKMQQAIKKGFGSPLGSGKQAIPWIHLDDLTALFDFCIAQQLEGVYNTIAGNTTNEELTVLFAKKLNKKMWLPNVPSFVLKLLLGELSVLVLTGIKASNAKLKATGFHFEKDVLEKAV